ncbi:flagellar hook-associated protein FlgL [Xenorhabdus bovienii]|uniref:flagellar hook-associated protein FlgL n=1 Tax=Xenorhabdus bovienii TaxID=40576 RepID=UPI00237D1D50|nr:flagellar hook-associated protein FlgL [Xenorhabdus bovienii]MDE1487775.1 flagellar hook-associated protein FlgL [Xenorhabdus bovienii]MDE9434398.1 flagellar hook-associated protein FlgL [Xenorhabdus bovienii]MDE9478672.1 flagellar hook-associated protein FlgL [Xenorhabdus bovienii]MDE9493912.1 flagellar hook-associated protein FlgL [Xenorhabdus bovienii]MDE9496682.1 flagellar hook-associated protein FlgL [Xenorhabdus bovienii]
MRVSTNLLYSQKMDGILGAQSKWMRYGEQLSTGKRVINPSDDPLAASQSIMVSQSESKNQQFMTARIFARNSMSAQLSITSNIVSVATNVFETLVAAADEQSDQDRESYAQQLEGFKQQLLNLGNKTDGNGRYIFGGYKTDVPPFKADESGKIHYKGGHDEITQKVDDNRSMIIAHTGQQVFLSTTTNPIKEPNGGTGEPDVFATLDLAIKALRTPYSTASESEKNDAMELINKANRGIRNSLDNFSSVEAVLGLQLQELEQLDSLGSERSISNKVRTGELVDVDWASSISSYYQQQAALQASYKAFTDLKGLSLFEMYR